MISLIIPTLNAEKYIRPLLDSVYKQTVQPHEIIIVDSESNDKTIKVASEYRGVKIIQICRDEFDHGKTRDMALKAAKGDVIIFMTQDALPANEFLIEKLVYPLLNEKDVVLTTARQIPRSDATRMEKLVRNFNYPDKSQIRSKEDIPSMGIKTFFSSDVCAAYDRGVYIQLGGFEYPIKTNEDMFYAAKVIYSGYRIAYVADAMVIHSHNFTLREQYNRNYIQGIEIEKRKDMLCGASQVGEGMRLVKYVSIELLKRGHLISFVRFGFDCCVRLIGSKAGKKKYRKSKS